MQGVAAAENSYQNALAYCKDRRSMRSLNGTIDEKSFADPLIVHGDIRKNLLFQRAIALGGRSMIYQCVQMADEVWCSKYILGFFFHIEVTVFYATVLYRWWLPNSRIRI
jgi:alkylation response protein AidB-like acyl-CoA dehydrogenase